MSLMDEKVSKSGNVSRDGRSRITTSTQPESISSDELFRKATRDEGEDTKEDAVEEEQEAEDGEGEGEKGGAGRSDGDDRDHDHDQKSSRSKKGRKKGSSSSHGESGKDTEKHQDENDIEGLVKDKEQQQEQEEDKEEKPIIIYKKRAAKKNPESRGDDTSQDNFNKPMTLVAISSEERSHASSISSSSTIEEDWDSDEDDEDEDGGKSKHKEVKDKILGGAKSFATRGKSALGGLKELKGTSRKWQSALFM